MKKGLSLLTMALAGIFGSSVQAQHNISIHQASQASVQEVLKYDRGMINSNLPSPGPVQTNSGARAKGATGGVVIAESQYDLMTNAAIDNRTQKNSDGTVTAVYTWSNAQDPFANRGTGYSYWSNNSWSAKPTARIENQRTGWPSYLTLANGKEVVISHSTANDRLYMAHRSTKGSGTWTEVLDPTGAATASVGSGYLLWPRAVSGGKNGNSIHMIALTEPTGGNFAGQRYAGMNGALTYNRSTDGGQTWDIKHAVLKGIDTTAYDYINGDAYGIVARGDIVAIAVYHRFGHTTILKSTDNGSTWTMHRPLQFRYDRYNLGDFLINDSVVTCDNTGDMIIDNNGEVHLFFSTWRWKDDNITDSVYTVYRFDNGLHYWRESFGDNNHVRLQGLIDQDGNPNNLAFVNANPIADYGSKALNSYASAGIDASGNLYVLFAGVMEEGSNGTSGKQYHFNNFHYRHTFVMKSTDGGCTWGKPLDLTDDGTGFEECVYGAMAKDVDSKIRFTYMEDINPGTYVGPTGQGGSHPQTNNEIVYVEKNVTSIPNDNYKCITVIKGDRELCPGDSIYLDASASCASSYSWSNGASTPGIWVTSTGNYKCTMQTKCGSIVDSAEVKSPVQGVGPRISLSADDNALCPSGSSTVIRLQSSSLGAQGTIQWGTGTPGSVDTNVVNTPGTYNVQVVNCVGGRSNATITIDQVTAANATITGRAFICPGDSSELIAAKNPAGSYTWTFGGNVISNNQNVIANQTGRYSLLTTACGGLYQDTTSVNVQVEPTPTASITNQGSLVVCEKSGATLDLLANGQTGATFKWSTGATGSFIRVNTDSVHTASYTVTSFNACGDSTVSSGVNVEVKAKPQPPAISFATGVFTSNNANSVWYFEDAGNWKPTGATGLTYSPSNLNNGTKVVARITSGGCESDNSNEVEYRTTVGFEDLNNPSAAINVYPNPNNGKFSVEFARVNNMDVTVSILNVVGQVIYHSDMKLSGEHTEVIDLQNVESGMYYISINNGSQKITKQVIIE